MTTSIAIPWRLRKSRYQLVGNICPDCNQASFPPREVCVHCVQKSEPLFPLDRNGEIFEDVLAATSLIEAHA